MRVHLSLGSNVGDRIAQLERARHLLESVASIHVVAASNCYETEPVGVDYQPSFYNMVVEIETALEPLELLRTVKRIEGEMGRKPSRRWGPREIDIDIVLWEDRCVTVDDLTVPHREFRHRAFVLTPLAEIAPDAVDPITGFTVAELAERPEAEGKIYRQIAALGHAHT